MECKKHGENRPAFVCKHLQNGEGVGFIESQDTFDPEWPFKNTWCADCEKVLVLEGEWNNVSENFAGVMAICEGCYQDIKKRNNRS
ncbi:MAG TPA: hypothetical protein VLB82_12225 [Thermodesulfobacteriota bacterium]|nr:hypothetical protein [Thermodesulfobacteriota bacterium]